MKTKALILAMLLIISTALFAGCTNITPAATTKAPAATTASGATTVDANAAASVVSDAAAFEKSIGPSGNWIICTTKDLTVTKELTLAGEFKNGKQDTAGKDVIQRKIGLYTQDADRKVTARFTLTIPKLTITSPNASIEYGTVVGDLYISVNAFKLVDAKVTGNVYFTKQEYKDSFVKDATSTISGKTEVKTN
ncbi:MAG TPA: hypothetical protein VIL27_09775 [Clostridia bacterium]